MAVGIAPAELKPKPEKSARAKLSQKEHEEAAASAAATVVSTLDLGAASLFGDECAMLPAERRAIEQPLARVLERVEPQVLEAAATWTDPLALALGLFAWLGRVIRVVRARQQAEAEAQAAALSVEQPPEPPAPPQRPAAEERKAVTVPADPAVVARAMPGQI